MLKGINKETIELTSNLGNNIIEVKNFLDVGYVVSNYLNEGLYEACKIANIEFKDKKKLNLCEHITYTIKILLKDNIFILSCKESGNYNNSDKVFVRMKGITYENLITAYEIITKKYLIKVLNDKIDDIVRDNKNIIN